MDSLISDFKIFTCLHEIENQTKRKKKTMKFPNKCKQKFRGNANYASLNVGVSISNAKPIIQCSILEN